MWYVAQKQNYLMTTIHNTKLFGLAMTRMQHSQYKRIIVLRQRNIINTHSSDDKNLKVWMHLLLFSIDSNSSSLSIYGNKNPVLRRFLRH